MCLNRDYYSFGSYSRSLPAHLKGNQSCQLALHWVVALQQIHHVEGFEFGWRLYWLHQVSLLTMQVVHVLLRLRLSNVLQPPSMASLDLIAIGSYLRPSPQEAASSRSLPISAPPVAASIIILVFGFNLL